jgi:hypothetical protein
MSFWPSPNQSSMCHGLRQSFLTFSIHSPRGERPLDVEMVLKFGAALRKLAYENLEVHRWMLEVQHLIKPRSILREPEIAARVMAVMAQA